MSKEDDIFRLDKAHAALASGRKITESVEDTLNGRLNAEADRLCGVGRYKRSADRVDTRAGHHECKLHTKAGEVNLKVPELRSLPFETQIIERYRRKESSAARFTSIAMSGPQCLRVRSKRS